MINSISRHSHIAIHHNDAFHSRTFDPDLLDAVQCGRTLPSEGELINRLVSAAFFAQLGELNNLKCFASFLETSVAVPPRIKLDNVRNESWKFGSYGLPSLINHNQLTACTHMHK